jgi:hypothetical protein
MWCVAELTSEYIEKMEDTLGIYEKPYDPNLSELRFLNARASSGSGFKVNVRLLYTVTPGLCTGSGRP